MSIRFWCARCGRSYLAKDEHAGKKVRCKVCAHVQEIPTPIPRTAGDMAEALVVNEHVEPMPRSNAPEPAEPVSDQPIRTLKVRSRLIEEILRAGARESSLLQGVALCLVALSAADLFVTYSLLRRGGGFYESNPVARWFFERWNIAGMAIYKFSIIGGVVGLGEVIERHRPGWGRGVLLLGCVAAAAVVVHGIRLLMGMGSAE